MQASNKYEISENQDEFLFPKKLSFSKLPPEILQVLANTEANKYCNNLHHLDKKGVTLIHFEKNIYAFNSESLYGVSKADSEQTVRLITLFNLKETNRDKLFSFN